MNIEHYMKESPSALHERCQNKDMTLIFADGSVTMNDRVCLIHRILWIPYLHVGMMPLSTDIFNIVPFTVDVPSKSHSKMFERYLREAGNGKTDHMDFTLGRFDSIQELQHYALNCLGDCVSSISQVALCKLAYHPKVQEMRNRKVDPHGGTRVWEAQFVEDGKVIMELIRSNEIPDNPFKVMAETNILKSNQIPQSMISYGPRSDIEDTIYNNIILGCSSKGTQNTTEFAIEQLSTKKASYFNNRVIAMAQYFARLLRIVSFQRPFLYPGSCGTTKLSKLVIAEGTSSNYVDIMVKKSDGSWHEITKDNHKDFVNIPLEKYSPINCKHEHGVCETCFGKLHAKAYFPYGIHMGILSATKVAAKISQMILSSKHLIRTLSMMFNMDGLGAKWLEAALKQIKLQDGIPEAIFERGYLGISIDEIGPLTDLIYSNEFMCKSYSSISEIRFYDAGLEEVCFVSFRDNSKLPNLSLDFLMHMKKNIDSIKSDGSTVYLPINKFAAPILDYQVVNDDMVGFTKRIETFLKKDISNYTNYNDILHDFTELVYDKANVNIRYIEILLRMFVVNKEGYDLVVEADSSDVHAMAINNRVEKLAISSKLCHQELMRYFKVPSTYLYPKPAGLYDPIALGINIPT